ncbi:cytochrome P450 [Cercophora scortea]|uniref:Cytochrome P450 n=1 Tax=Cercophora scortea TaxID=314031 RepID=A0AAE0I8D4_9PEZI|nr:cytochrome P450 [Cercophora scortea]
MALLDAIQHVGTGPIPSTFGIFVFLAVLYIAYQRLLPQPFPGIPYNKQSARSPLGDAPDMFREVRRTRELNVWLAKQVEKLQAPLVQVFVQPFSKPWLLVANSVEGQDILMRRPEFDRSDLITDGMRVLDGFHARFKTGNLTRTNKAWLQDLMTPSFLNNIVSPMIYHNSENLVHFWKTKTRLANGRSFDVHADLDNSAFDGMLAFMFGRHFKHTALGPQIDAASKLTAATVEVGPNGEAKFPNAPFNEFIEGVYEMVEAIDWAAQSLSPSLATRWFRKTAKYRHVKAVERRVILQLFRNGLSSIEATGEAKTAIECMLMRERKAAEKQDREPDYSNQTMIDEACPSIPPNKAIGGQFIAGLHTTSSTLAFVLIYLTRHPEAQTKLRRALHRTYSAALAENRAPTMAELTKTRVPYLEAVIEETLRLHATSITRQAIRDTELLGHHVPKGTNIIVIANGPGFHAPSLPLDPAMHSATAKLNNNWDESRDMKAFLPERWLVGAGHDDEGEFDANAALNIAFGLGPRGCWGRRLAYMEMRSILTLVLWNFDLLAIEPVLADPKLSYSVVHRANHCYVKLQARGEGPVA